MKRRLATAVLLAAFFLCASRLPACAEDPGASTIAVLDPGSGGLLGWYRTDRVVKEQILHRQEFPHFPYTLRFSGLNADRLQYYVSFGDERKKRDENPAPAGQPDHLGKLRGRPYFFATYPNGERLVFLKTNLDTYDMDRGPVGIVGRDQRLRVLVKSVTCTWAGRSNYYQNPLMTFAGPYLLTDDKQGMTCRHLPDGRVLWRAPLHFGHCRNLWGAWYQGGALLIDTTNGLARVDPSSGRIRWTWRDAGEIEAIRQYPDGRLYVGFINQPLHRPAATLGRAAVQRYHWPNAPKGGLYPFFIRVTPYGTSYFGITWSEKGEPTFDRGRAAVWEYKNGRWAWIFDYDCKGKEVAALNALYAKNGFSPAIRRRLTTRDDDFGPQPDEL